MRLLFVSNIFPPYHIGGYELVCQRTSEALRDRGHEVHILTSGPHGQDGNSENPFVRRLLTCAYRPPDYFPDASHQQAEANARVLVEEIERISPDVVMLWDTHGIGLLDLFTAALRKNVQVTTRIGDYQFWPNWDRTQPMPEPNLSMLLDPRVRIAVNARTLGADHVRAGVPIERLALLNPWVEIPHDTLPPSPAPPPPFRVVWAGRLSHRKGLHVAVEGLRLLVGKYRVPASLDVIGSGESDELQQNTTRAGEPEREGSAPFPIKSLGPMERSQFLRHLSGYHAMVVPSIGIEGFGTICIEAMACGVPVVASRIGGFIEATADGRLGLLFEPGDPEALAAHISRLAKDSRLRARLRERGYQHVRALYERDVSMNRFEAFLEQSSHGLPVSAMSSLVPKMADPPPYGRAPLPSIAGWLASILGIDGADPSRWYERLQHFFG